MNTFDSNNIIKHFPYFLTATYVLDCYLDSIYNHRITNLKATDVLILNAMALVSSYIIEYSQKIITEHSEIPVTLDHSVADTDNQVPEY